MIQLSDHNLISWNKNHLKFYSWHENPRGTNSNSIPIIMASQLQQFDKTTRNFKKWKYYKPSSQFRTYD
jgi:hypothetical protein